MEHLDLAGYMNTPVTWNLSAFEQQGEYEIWINCELKEEKK